MDKRTEIFADKVAEFLRDLMDKRGVTANQILATGKINKPQLYAVLRMGNPQRPNYSIETFVKVLSILQVHLEFHDLKEKSNFDLVPNNDKPSLN